MPLRAPRDASSRKTIRDIRKSWYTPRERPVKMHRFLMRVKELFLGNLASFNCICSRASVGRSGSLRNALNSLCFSSYLAANWRRWLSWMLRFSRWISISLLDYYNKKKRERLYIARPIGSFWVYILKLAI
jgi:hypothetical protein